jgi:hypothetical protein
VKLVLDYLPLFLPFKSRVVRCKVVLVAVQRGFLMADAMSIIHRKSYSVGFISTG